MDKPYEAAELLREAGFAVQEIDVLALEVADEPGGLSQVLEPLVEKGMSIDYVFCFLGRREGKAVIIIRVSAVEEAIETISAAGFRLISEAELYKL